MSTGAATVGREISPLLLSSLDNIWERTRGRLETLDQHEYLWEPTAGCWSVHQDQDGVWRVAIAEPEPDPAPVTTIAWRLWHIASDCLASYTARGLGEWPLPVHGYDWYEHMDDAVAAVDLAWEAFRSGVAALGEDGLWVALGERWGR